MTMRSPGTSQFFELPVASAATCDIGAIDAMKIDITGSVTITSFGTSIHLLRFIRFSAALTLTHNATSMILPNGGNNIVTAAGDTCIATSDGSGNWRVRDYQRADGTPLALTEGSWTPTYTPGGGAFTGATITLNQAVYQKIGNWVECSVDFTIVAIGSGSPTGAISISLPFTPAGRGYADGFEQALTGSGLRGVHAASAALSITFLTGSTVIANGNRVIISNIKFKV